MVFVGKVSEWTRSSGHSTSAQNMPFGVIPRSSVTRTYPHPGKYHPGCGTCGDECPPTAPYFAAADKLHCDSPEDATGSSFIPF